MREQLSSPLLSLPKWSVSTLRQTRCDNIKYYFSESREVILLLFSMGEHWGDIKKHEVLIGEKIFLGVPWCEAFTDKFSQYVFWRCLFSLGVALILDSSDVLLCYTWIGFSGFQRYFYPRRVKWLRCKNAIFVRANQIMVLNKVQTMGRSIISASSWRKWGGNIETPWPYFVRSEQNRIWIAQMGRRICFFV